MSRKYRQRGYQDDNREPRARPTAGPRREREGPRGRGLGRPTATRFRCARCGHRVVDLEVAADAVCGGCGSDLHTCSNCAHFDSSAPRQCRKPIPAAIPAKSKRNECDLFEPKIVQELDEGGGRSGDDPRAEFDALFDF